MSTVAAAACYVPFNGRNLDLSFFMLKPTWACGGDAHALHALKQVSLYCTETLGCVHSSILRSIHGNLIVWYGAWMKKSEEQKELLSSTLLSMLINTTGMDVLTDQCFFSAYTGESRDGLPAARFFTGDIVSMSSASLPASEARENSVAYACLAMFKERFRKMDGANCGVCFKSQSLEQPRLLCLFAWRSLQLCYSYILKTDFKNAIAPYLDFSLDIKYDIFRVLYVSGDVECSVLSEE